MENNQLQTIKEVKIPSFLTEAQIQKYSDVDKAVTELFQSGLTGMSMTFAKITVVEKIEKVLDTDFMAKVMNLKGKEYGFKTDERSGENYPESKVKPAIVQAMMFGAEITGNEFNILGGNCYLTKNFCKNWLRKNKIWYKIPCQLSQKAENGTFFIRVFAEWLDFENCKHKETLDIPVAKHASTSEATMKGCAERDAMAYIIEELRKESLPMDKREDFKDTPYEDVTEKDKTKYHAAPVYNEQVQPQTSAQDTEQGAKAEQHTDTAQPQSNAQSQAETTNTNGTTHTSSQQDANKPQMVDANTQTEFDNFINNKNKVKTIQDLTARAKNFCATKGITSIQLNFDKYNEIKGAIDGGTWL